MLQTELDHLYTDTPTDAISLEIIESLEDVTLSLAQAKQLALLHPESALKANEYIPLFDDKGTLTRVLVGHNPDEPFFTLGEAYHRLPEGHYQLSAQLSDEALFEHLLSFGLGAYQFDQYKTAKRRKVSFYLPYIVQSSVKNALSAHYLTRDLINEPANALTPDNFATQIRAELAGLPVEIKEIAGTDLLKQNFPLIYTVGAASRYQPRLIEITSGDPSHPKLTLIGKGVTFDSGGLDIKPANAMRLMQKDMGGAAHALALGKWILQEAWPIQLQILLPIVENSISERAMRPGDIVKSRSGLTVEIDNTDAEGRLILADTLTYALEQPTDFILDFATLTGAARVALGPEIPALFTNDDSFATLMNQTALAQCDTIWRLPFHQPYQAWIESEQADISNSGSVPYAGAITAALFLERFVQTDLPYAHIDVMAWNIRHRSGRPKGGEAMGLRAAYGALKHYLTENKA